jgi:alkanesulfonate monooxygenase SsuD/methylene tetrahydromethanopterin reductase-like flavin-dependent oxidoreductase (luciferase family)
MHHKPHRQVGVYAPISHPEGLPPIGDIYEFIRSADQGPFDSLWVGDHLLWHVPFLEATTTLAAMAALTQRADLGVNVYLPALRAGLVSARVFGNIDYLSAGRLRLGVGIGGENPAEFAAVGIRLAERRLKFDEALDELLDWGRRTAGQNAEGIGYMGRQVPLWMGGRVDAALRRTVERGADVWSAHLMSPDRVRDARRRLEMHATELDRPAPDVAVTVFVNVKSDVRPRDGLPFLRTHFGPEATNLDKYLVEGDLRSCAQQLREFRSCVDHLLIFPATSHPWRQLEELTFLAEDFLEGGPTAA